MMARWETRGDRMRMRAASSHLAALFAVGNLAALDVDDLAARNTLVGNVFAVAGQAVGLCVLGIGAE